MFATTRLGGHLLHDRLSGSSPFVFVTVPDYEVMTENDYPLSDSDGPIPAMNVGVHTIASSEEAIRAIAKDLQGDYPDQDVVGMSFGDIYDLATDVEEFPFFVLVRNERAADAMGYRYHVEDFADGPKIVSEEQAAAFEEQATQDQDENSGTGNGSAQAQQAPKKPMTVEEKIRQKVGETFTTPNESIENMTIQDDGAGCYSVAVTHKATPNLLSAGVHTAGLELHAQDIYTVLYSDTELANVVSNATVDATTELTDQYGNVSNEVVYSTSMYSVTANQLNWQNPYGIDFPSVWTLNYIHPSVEQQMVEEQLQKELDCAQDDGLFDADIFCE